MGIFQSEFVGIHGEEREALHKEAWEKFAAHVRRLEATGAMKGRAEVESLGLTRSEFLRAHPELDPAKVSFRVVGP